MKKLTKILALAALTVFGALPLCSSAADILDIAPCDREGNPVTPVHTRDNPMINGEKAYFKMRFLWREKPEEGEPHWDLTYTGIGSQTIGDALPLQVGIYVSGELRYATYCGKRTDFGKALTDIIFEYQVQAGDFALPILLAVDTENGTAPASDKSDQNVRGYHLNPARYGIGNWQLLFPISDVERVAAEWTVLANVPADRKPDVAVNFVKDYSLAKGQYFVRTIDFAPNWQTAKKVWRTVHENSTNADRTPQLVATPATEQPVTLYVWSTNEDVVVVAGSNVREVEMIDPADPFSTKTYHVAPVTFAKGIDSIDFTLKGVSQTVNGGSAGLVLSAYDHFNKSDSTMDMVIDFISVPVRCIEPLPPSVIVEAEKATAYATSDWLTSANRILIKTSEPIAQEFKVTLDIKRSDGTEMVGGWKNYVRFSKTDAFVSTLPDATEESRTVTLGAGVDEVSLFVFCLRGQGKTEDYQLQFKATSDNLPGMIKPENLGMTGFSVVAQDPVIEQPAENATLEFVQGDATPITIKITDDYADYYSEDGYALWVTYRVGASGDAGKRIQIVGKYKPGNGGILYRCDDGSNALPELTYLQYDENPFKTAIDVVAPVSGKSSAGEAVVYRTFYASIRKARYSTAFTDSEEYDESDVNSVNINITLDEKGNDTGKTLYAFLKPTMDIEDFSIFDTKSTFIIGNADSSGRNKGIQILANQATLEKPVVGKVQFKDGGDGLDSWRDLQFEVVFCSSQYYDEDKIVRGFDMLSPLDIRINNVEPTVKRIEVNGIESEGNGHLFSMQYPKGQKQKLVAKIDDVKYDLNQTEKDYEFQCKWTAKCMIDGKAVETFTETISGNPDATPWEYNFPRAGLWTVTLKVKDKDMDDFSESVYEIQLETLDQPGLNVEVSSEYIDETEISGPSRGYVTISPTYFDAAENLVVQVTVKPGKDGAVNAGTLVLDSSFKTSPNPAKWPEGDNIYFLTFGNTAPQKIGIEEMDGTSTSRINGFVIEAKVVSDGPSSDPTQTWAEYYKPQTAKIYPQNVAPNNGDEAKTFRLEANSVTNRFEVSGGVAEGYPLNWTVGTDVAADFEAGITVTIVGGGGEDYNDDGFEKGVKKVTEPTSGRFIPNFGLSQGDQQVTITIADKDGDSIERTWYFTIKPARFLETTAHGPGGGTSSSMLSSRYSVAGGLGKGHTWAEGATFVSANAFRLNWNCADKTKINVFAWGYKVGAIDDGSLNSGRDQSIYADGHAKNGDAVNDPYVYDDPVYDSYFYLWLNLTKDENGGATETVLGSIAPEQPLLEAGASSVDLPTEAGDDGKYIQTVVEAIFSRERYAADNMGDINADGIPDLYFQKYFMTDPETGMPADLNTVNDLKDVSLDNGDLDKDGNAAPDYLPAMIDAPFTVFTGLKIDPIDFKAIWEVRGFGAGLNDAPALAGITGVKPDRHYSDPDEDEKSTLSRTEWLAWQEYAAANDLAIDNPDAWTKWSPERPTSPILCDTDGDGFADGFEYYFWYRAHVGYLDEFGNHRYETGRRYDARNPGEGKQITSAEIEKTMDPITGDGESALTRDSDNDGLPDTIEFYLGTNPFDFDTDGDGLPDGWEIMIAGTDPLLTASYTDASADTTRNSDGDAMAISSPGLEPSVYPAPFFVQQWNTVAVIDPNGDSDGVQWYASKNEIEIEEKEEVTLTSFTVAGDTKHLFAAAPDALKTVEVADGIRRLAKALERDVCFTIVSNETGAVRGYPVYLAQGTVIQLDNDALPCKVYTIKETVAAKDANACWVYGKGGADVLKGDMPSKVSGYGFLALARHQAIPEGKVVCALPVSSGDEKNGRDVAYLHYLVYQEFGFDPRTAWNATDPLAARWGRSIDGQTVDGILQIRQGGYTGKPTRTRAYAAYDEFLVYSFFVNNGCDMSGLTIVTGDTAPYLARLWGAFTTNPQGPGDVALSGVEYAVTTADGKEVTTTYYGVNDVNGADTDHDGVPDGWELYTMSGPKMTKSDLTGSWQEFVMAPPYAGFAGAKSGAAYALPSSFFSPFIAGANTINTSNQIYLGGQGNDDGLNQLREFSGTDSSAYYAGIYADAEERTILPREQQTGAPDTVYSADDSKWLNKFFPTDPWNVDTDGDGLSDSAEGDAFVYGTPADNGSLLSIPGGGLNPLTVDTDLDGLPDPWEKQFAGTGSSLYAGEFVDKAKDADGHEVGNALQGLTDGMDGTVADAYSYPITYTAGKDVAAGGSTNVTTYVRTGGFAQVVNRDYDHDGLENWQEYLVGTMRCWRYDDPISSWSYIPDDKYVYMAVESTPGVTNLIFDAEASAAKFGYANAGEFWYNTLVDKTSPSYNPQLVTGMSSGAQYFSRVVNGWDRAYLDGVLGGNSGAYYYFPDRVGEEKIADLWVGNAMQKGPLFDIVNAIGCRTAPSKYICCSPLKADSDGDGMDDYYELFHGMNPLLGESGRIQESNTPCDLVYDAWYASGKGAPEAWGEGATANYWQLNPPKAPRGNGYDFEVFPWLNGLATADPDGDDIRNQEEAIMPMINPTTAWHHTDPTPVWMTDSSYSNSLTRRFFRLPTRFENVIASIGEAGFTYKGETYYFRDCDGFVEGEMVTDAGSIPVYGYLPFTPDMWKLSANGKMNWIASFEENEGYDSDHDGISDYEELQGKFRAASDPQDVDSPRRRQAMYFQGDAKPGILQTLPEIKEEHPVGATIYPDDMAFLQYTVECWVMPEDARNQTIVERAVWSDYSNPGDNEFMRKNFQLAIKNGKWYTKFDPSGTLSNKQVEVFSDTVAKIGQWTHIAATYNGSELVLYVNGVAEVPVLSSLQPEYGASAVAVRNEGNKTGADGFATFWRTLDYDYKAIIVGASAKGEVDGRHNGLALDLTQAQGFAAYKDFFKGYVDEIRIWDGARTADEIKESMKVRYTAELAKENREDFYDVWSQQGATDQHRGRYAKDDKGNAYALPAELRYHFAFDSVFGAENEVAVAKTPHGFDNGEKAPLSRPAGYRIDWFANILDGYADTVYANPTWVTWVPNTIAHLPRFDGTTLDSMFWSEGFSGTDSGAYKFACTAEPVSFWTQLTRNQVDTRMDYYSTPWRHRWINDEVNRANNYKALFEFTGRHLNQVGDDLIPLGGAYVKYMTKLWDGQGASDNWEITGVDTDNDGIPDWWQAQNPGGTLADYLLDLRKNGAHMDANGAYATDEAFGQTADIDGDGMYDWWEDLYGVQGNDKTDAEKDSDDDGLSNYDEFLVAMGDAPYGFTNLNPFAARTFGQKALDYFLPVPTDGADGKHFFAGEYLGAVLTDHDFMEDWWENQHGLDYNSSHVYDPWDDRDGNGWSNFAECRAFMWGGAFSADLIDRWLDGSRGEENNHVLCYPRPAIGVKVMYDTDQIQDVAGKGLVVRTSTTGKRVDASFLIRGTDVDIVEAQDHVIGAYYDGATKIRGFLNPGCLIPIDIKLHKAQLTAADTYYWRYYWTKKDYEDNNDNYWSQSGTYADYRAAKRAWEYIRLESAQLNWGDPIAQVTSDVEGHYGQFIYCADGFASVNVGTIDCWTGEYTLDLAKMKEIDASVGDSIFKLCYSYKIGKNWPQTLWLSDTFDDPHDDDETSGNWLNGSGRIREGLNTIEVFMDFNNNGRYDVGEPYGVAKNVQVGWHKVPMITIELTDEAKSVQRTAIVAVSGEAEDDEDGGGEEGATTKAVNVRIVRESINGISEANGVTLKERALVNKQFVMDDRAYLTEADVVTAKKPDLDWQYLNKDAARLGIVSPTYATYRIEQYEIQPDGSVSAQEIARFTREFGEARPSVAAVSPIDDAPVYSDAPTFRFTADEKATAFSIQVATANGKIIYDSGVKMLGGRAAVTVGKSAYEFTAPIYADVSVLTNGAPVLTDSMKYQWRVAAYNAKYATAKDGDYSVWVPFQMDVANRNRYNDQPTGYGRADAIVRYYGPARANDLSNCIVVEAFENADFTGQAMAQTRVNNVNGIASLDDLTTVNARLMGIVPGTVYLRAYIDLNNNGKWDKFEPWGYANDRGSTHTAFFSPVGVTVGATAADLAAPNSAVIYIEDTDWNKNEIPDCLELERFPATSEQDDLDEDAFDWWSWAGLDSDESDYAEEGDVMAYAEVKGVLVGLGVGGDDVNITYYLLAEDEKVPEVGAPALGLKYVSCYEYGHAADAAAQRYGMGTNVVLSSEALRVKSVSSVTVALVHNQVYQEFGFDTLTANPDAYAKGTAVNTKPFTAEDKQLLLRYFAAIGFVDAVDYPADSGKSFDEYLTTLALVDPSKARELWAKYSLKPGVIDSNLDGIPDGWQLYVMFGPNGEVAASTPWATWDDARTVTPDNEGLNWVEEYDHGDYPTDPWTVSTFGDRYTTDKGEFVISDKDAYDFHLKGEHKYEDADNDGLINLEEYVAQKNDDYALNVDKMNTYFGLNVYPELEGQCVPDYFLRSFLSPKYYLGFKITSHDFIESWWKDQYDWSSLMSLNKEPRKFFMPYGDPDGDGWSNWSEARAGTSPTKVAASAIDDYVTEEFPIPVIDMTVSLPELNGSNSAIVVEAYSSSADSTKPDAKWLVGGAAAGAGEKFLGFNPAIAKSYNLGGSIVPGTFKLEFKDLTADHETWDTNKTRKVSSLKVNYEENIWASAVVDTKIDNSSAEGYLVDRGDGNTIFGTINYETGAVTVDFGSIVAWYGLNGAWRTWSSDTECVATYLWKSYVRASWTTKASAASFAKTQSITLSDATEGHLVEGKSTFVAFADANGNGEYDPGEPFGMAKDVDVGWDKVNNLNIALSTSSSVLPRFKPADIAGSAEAETSGEEAGTDGTSMTSGAPVIEDVTADTYVRIVRWTINGEECKHRVIATKKVGADAVITEADILSKKTLDLDWKQLEQDAKDIFIDLKDVDVVEYAVFVGNVARTEENVNGWIVKKFPHNRANATPVAPTPTDTAIVNATRPEFEFKVPAGYAAYAFKLMDATGGVVFCSTELVTAKNADGNVVYQPPVYFGADAEDLVNHLLPTGKYSWSVAMLNAKFRSMEGGWCAPAEFTVQMAKGRVADNDKGFLEVAVRYYGEATVSTNSPIIVQAFKSADFTGVPAGQTVIYDGMGVTNIYTNTNSVNARIFGLTPGDYYVRAFIDTTNDVKRSTWESWGYQNNVGTGKKDLYTPVSTKVVGNDTSFALVFIEDMDVNNNMKPDCIEGLPADDEHDRKDADDGIDSDGDGLSDDEEESETGTDPYDWDTDGDGMPDGWEDWAGTDPLDPDDDYAVPGDVMAYEEVEMWLITTEDGTQLLLKEGETVPNPGDPLAGYGEAFYVPYEYGDVYGRGQQTAAPEGATVNRSGNNPPKKVKVALVHDQVYERHGFDPNTAVPGGSVNTKEFTALDKYLVLRYREMMGSNYWTDVHFELPEGYDDIEDYVNQNKLWPEWTLKPGNPDTDAQPTNPADGAAGIGDGIGDGWELYTHNNPWNYFDRTTDNDGDGTTLLEEYDFDPETGTAHPTDPANPDTDGDGVSDDLYHGYLLYDPAGDKDGDGLSNYSEYLITEVFKYAKVDARNPKTDGACVDYFRKLGDVYLGEVFQDHDQVNDTWEGWYYDVANRYVYDPDRDDDDDGWSNYAEYRANTDPGEVATLGVTDKEGKTYVKPEYPVPVIEAQVVYNGRDVNLANIVFKAWNETDDPDMTSAPDAIWTLQTTPGEGDKVLVGYTKYLGTKPQGAQHYLLTGGSVGVGTFELRMLNQSYVHTGFPTNAVAEDAQGEEPVVLNKKVEPIVEAGDPTAAEWYLVAQDVNGEIRTLAGATIGTIDYSTGIVDIDFSRISGMTNGDPSQGKAFASEITMTDGGHDYDTFSLDTANVRLGWSAVKVGTSPAGQYYLADADAVTPDAKHHGHVREGKNAFVCIVDENGDGDYTAGELYGFVRGVDVGWQGAKFTIEVTPTSPVFARVNINDGTNDRIVYWGSDSGDVDYKVANSNDTQVAAETLSGGIYNHVRIVPYMISGTKVDTALYDRDYVPAVLLLQNRVVAEFDINTQTKPFITEADFIRDGKFDIDWDLFDTTTFALDGQVVDAVGDVTAVKYRIVLGKDGPVGPESNLDDATVVRAFSTLIERRYEPIENRTLPTELSLAEGMNGGVVYSARPTFQWRLDEDTDVDGYAQSASLVAGAGRYGCSYTAFQIQIEDCDNGNALVYDSGVLRTPGRSQGKFTWTAPISAGDQTPLAKIFKRAGNYRWRVAMYNSKFKPGSNANRRSVNEGWSEYATFATDVGMQQVTDDHNYSSIDVAVKYAGPELVLSHCADTATTNGMVRVQAFATADFSGEPLSQAFITDKVALTNTTDLTANCTLYGLQVEGTYYVRAYIDSNGNFKKDDWESWGYATNSVTLTRGKDSPIIGLYIEDADTDQDWLPDAWEYEKFGDLSQEGAKVDPDGKIVLKTITLDAFKANGKANISTFLSGASLTFFQNLGNAGLLLGLGDVSYATIAEIRAAVEKNVDPDSVKITALTVDTTGRKVVLTVGAKATDSIGGYILSPVYTLPDSKEVTIKIYRKPNLATAGWGDPVKTVTTTITSSISERVEVPMPDIDFNNGFYKVEIVQ